MAPRCTGNGDPCISVSFEEDQRDGVSSSRPPCLVLMLQKCQPSRGWTITAFIVITVTRRKMRVMKIRLLQDYHQCTRLPAHKLFHLLMGRWGWGQDLTGCPG